MKRNVGESYEFLGESYTVLENHILPDEERMPFLYRMTWAALVFVIVGIGLMIVLFWGSINQAYNLWVIALLLFSFLPYVIIHELLHGISFVLFSKNPWNTMKFGLVLKNGVAYCISLVPVTIRRARISLMMPVYVVCIPMFLAAIVLNYFPLAVLSILFASGSVGDVYYMWKLRKFDKTLYMFEEEPSSHGYEIGFLIFSKQ